MDFLLLQILNPTATCFSSETLLILHLVMFAQVLVSGCDKEVHQVGYLDCQFSVRCTSVCEFVPHHYIPRAIGTFSETFDVPSAVAESASQRDRILFAALTSIPFHCVR